MKQNILIVFFLFLFSAANAQQQDTAYLKQQSDSIYNKGSKEVKRPKSQDKKTRSEAVELNRNIYALNVFDLFLQNISLSIEFAPGDGKISIVMPLTMYSPLGKAIEGGTNSDLGKYRSDLATYLRAGFEMNYYPYGQKRCSYFTGLSLLGAYMKRDVDVQVDEGKGIYQGLYFYFLNKQGVNISLSKRFCFLVSAHVGVKTYDLQTYSFALLGNVGVGWKF